VDVETAVEEAEPAEAPPRRRSRRTVVAGIALAALVVIVLGVGALAVADNRPNVTYDGPTEAVAPGGTVTATGEELGDCGLFVSLRRRGALGLWSQTHSGNVIHGFQRDERPWWRLRGGSYMTPVPCSIGGDATFDLPTDIDPGTYVACDTSRECVRFEVADQP
jgi:hypothetical protein